MLKITKQNGTRTVILEVTQGAFENIYRQQGFVPLQTADNRRQTAEDVPADQPPQSEEDLFRASVETKPISQWTNKELKQYATLVGIDPKSKDLRELIKRRQESGDRSQNSELLTPDS